ncbi:hypothetical protein DL98DRAFT_305403 [Cadophora sp. DSE1049]|nr:hypothetical protein DL98DRAFT_305403 [Cadophora sp. DSE1049]
MISIGYTDKITKFRVHILQLCLITICLIVSIARFASKARTTRSHTWFFAVCLKSVLVITYQLLSEHHYKFQKWASFKANAILNCLEFVFWFAAFIMMCMGNGAGCSGGSCALSPILAVLGLVLCFIGALAAFVSVKDWRSGKNGGGISTSASIKDDYGRAGIA